jgi:hypothetical protein
VTATFPVVVPGGSWIEGRRCNEAWIRPLTGADQVFFAEAAEGLFPAERTTALLARCVLRFGPVEPATTQLVRSMTIGDRESLLLHLRRATLGDVIQCVLTCPQPGCGERLDLDLRVADLILPPYPDLPERHELTVKADSTRYHVTFRIPTGGDQEAVLSVAAVDAEAAAAALIAACVDRVVAEGSEIEPAEMPPAAITALSEAMAELDPQAEIVLSATCPVCGGKFRALFDAGEYLARECGEARDLLDLEIHALAMHYHWAEADILALTLRRRRRYLALLQDSLSGGETE